MIALVIAADAPLTGGAIAGGIIYVFLMLCCLAAIGVGILMIRDGDYGAGPIACGIGCAVVFSAVALWSFWPLAYEYHHWIPKQGTVDVIDKRLVPTDDGMEEKVVVRLSNGGGVYGLKETRATLLKRGDFLQIRCKKAYDFGVPRSAHGWDCKLVNSRSAE